MVIRIQISSGLFGSFIVITDTQWVDHGCLQAGMAKQRLDGADIVIGPQKVGSEGVTKSVGGDLLGELCLADAMTERPLKLGFVEMVTMERSSQTKERQTFSKRKRSTQNEFRSKISRFRRDNP